MATADAADLRAERKRAAMNHRLEAEARLRAPTPVSVGGPKQRWGFWLSVPLWVLLLVAIVTFALAGCATGPAVPQTPQVRAILTVAQACDAYAYALEGLTPFRPALSIEADQAILDLNEGAAEFCAPGAPPPADAVDAVAMLADATQRVVVLIMAQRG
jgi:hypothetical protein